MADKKKPAFDNYIGFLWQTDKEKLVEFVVEADGRKTKYAHRARKLSHDFNGVKLQDCKCYTPLIFIDKIENITAISDNVKLRILKNE